MDDLSGEHRFDSALVRPKRKNIPVAVKLEITWRQKWCCAECRLPFQPGDVPEWDHRPALILRAINETGTDYIPPQLDPNHLELLHEQCHQKRTTGRALGATKTVTTKGSDAWLAKKFRKLEGKTRRVKVKIPQRKNYTWPKRKFR